MKDATTRNSMQHMPYANLNDYRVWHTPNQYRQALAQAPLMCVRNFSGRVARPHSMK